MDVIQPALESLGTGKSLFSIALLTTKKEQEVVAGQILLRYIKQLQVSIQEQVFIEQILQITMKFITSLISKTGTLREACI